MNIIKNTLTINLIFILLSVSLLRATEIRSSMVIANDSSYKIPLKQYSRIIVLDTATVENLYLLGALDKIIATGDTKGRIIPKEIIDKLNSVGSFAKPSLESIVSYKPDLVILGASTLNLSKELTNFNIPSIYLDVSGFDSIFNNTMILGKLVNKEEKATELVARSKAKLEKIKKDPLPKLSGAFLYSLNPLTVYSKGTIASDIMDLFGVVNIAPITTGSQPIISLEYILNKNPDFIIVTGEIKQVDKIMEAYPHLASTIAAKNNNITAISPMRIRVGSLNIFDTIDKLHSDLKKIKISR